jgi:hypothetical protein
MNPFNKRGISVLTGTALIMGMVVVCAAGAGDPTLFDSVPGGVLAIALLLC